MSKQLRVGMVGYAFMGAAHSQAWRTVNHAFDLPLTARMTAVCGRSADAVSAAASKLGWQSSATDWRSLIDRDDIDLIDICTPGDTHHEIALAALAAGKHVLCEKPLANTVAEAREMAAAAAQARPAGVRAMCGFNYRRVPAVALMRKLVADGRIGRIRHVRAVYLQDWIVDPQFPLVWRLRKDVAGSGALGDIGAHIVDLTQFVTGQSITSVSALTETFVRTRPLPASSSAGLSTLGSAATGSGRGGADGGAASGGPNGGRGGAEGGAASGGPNGGSAFGGVEVGEVTVDDAALFLARLDGGAVATYEASRFATGRKNGLRVELNGSLGSVAFDFERMNELEFYDATRPSAEQGFSRVLVTEPDHPYMAAWWPPGHPIGYEHSFTHEIRDLIEAIGIGQDPAPSFADALQVQLVLDAVSRSADSAQWTDVEAVFESA